MELQRPAPWLVGVSGLVGNVFFGLYFGVPAFFPKMEALVYSARPSTADVMAVGAQYHGLTAVGTWLQATGATLCVIFFLGLVTLSGAGGSLAGRIVQLGGAVLVALVLVEGLFTLTWITEASAGASIGARAGYDMMSRFIQVFPVVPAPAVYLPLAWILLHSDLLPRWLGWVALGLGGAFLVVGIAEVFLPLAQACAAGLASLQDVWIIVASILLMARGRSEASGLRSFAEETSASS